MQWARLLVIRESKTSLCTATFIHSEKSNIPIQSNPDKWNMTYMTGSSQIEWNIGFATTVCLLYHKLFIDLYTHL